MSCSRPSPCSQSGFSLVEVVIAMGVVAFCLVAILSLFSVGLRSSRESVEEIHAASVASSLLARMRAGPKADLRSAGFPFGPLTNSGGNLFQIPPDSPKYLKGDGTVAATANESLASRGCALSGRGDFDDATRVATVSLTLWWPAAAPLAKASGRYTISTCFDTETR